MLRRDDIVGALARLAEVLRTRGVQGELCLLGGTVMLLAFKARAATKDVDGVFEPAAMIREAARIVGAELSLPVDWLNDAAKGFVSANHDVVEGDLPQFEHLRLTAPTAEYMLAMKCMASRLGLATDAPTDGPSDAADIAFLIRHLGLRSAEEALAIVARYYPAGQIPARAGYLLDELFQDFEAKP